jgi:hypothetical protein
MTLIGVKPKLSQDQLAIIDLVKETLAQCLAGEISSIGIVACMKSGYATVMSGRQAADLNLGCDSLKMKILNAVETAGDDMVKRSVKPQAWM